MVTSEGVSIKTRNPHAIRHCMCSVSLPPHPLVRTLLFYSTLRDVDLTQHLPRPISLCVSIPIRLVFLSRDVAHYCTHITCVARRCCAMYCTYRTWYNMSYASGRALDAGGPGVLRGDRQPVRAPRHRPPVAPPVPGLDGYAAQDGGHVEDVG